MIYSNSNQIVIFSPPKTGTKARIMLYNSICDRILFHVSFVDFIKKYPEVKEYTKMCFVRNPWNRFISYFHMFNRDRSLSEQKKIFKSWAINFDMKSMDLYYCNENKEIAVDKIFQVEKWQESIEEINQKINYQPNKNLINNKIYDTNIYKEWFDQEMIDFIADKEKITIDKFNYTFEN